MNPPSNIKQLYKFILVQANMSLLLFLLLHLQPLPSLSLLSPKKMTVFIDYKKQIVVIVTFTLQVFGFVAI